MSESCSSGRLSSCDLGAVIVQEQPGRSLVRSIRPLVTDFYQTYHGRCVVVRRLLNIYVLNTARVVLSYDCHSTINLCEPDIEGFRQYRVCEDFEDIIS